MTEMRKGKELWEFEIENQASRRKIHKIRILLKHDAMARKWRWKMSINWVTAITHWRRGAQWKHRRERNRQAAARWDRGRHPIWRWDRTSEESRASSSASLPPLEHESLGRGRSTILRLSVSSNSRDAKKVPYCPLLDRI